MLSHRRHLDGTLKTMKYHGHKRERTLAIIEDSDIVLTTYHTLAVDFAAKKSPIHEVRWFRVVLDEGTQTIPFLTVIFRAEVNKIVAGFAVSASLRFAPPKHEIARVFGRCQAVASRKALVPDLIKSNSYPMGIKIPEKKFASLLCY